jgi:hypothetical protein
MLIHVLIKKEVVQLEYYNMKKLQDFTVKEFNQYYELMKEENKDVKAILTLFGVDVDKQPATGLPDLIATINAMTLSKGVLKNYYKINDTEYYLEKDIRKLTASQFVDFQIYSVDMKMETILSVFLLPVRKSGFFGKKHCKYGEGYDILKVQNDILNHMKIADAQTISDFFLHLSMKLFVIIQGYLENKKVKMEKDMVKKEKEVQHQLLTNGKKQPKMWQKQKGTP